MIPDWFDISPYLKVKDYDSSQWLFELQMRARFYPLPHDFGSTEEPLFKWNWSRLDKENDPYLAKQWKSELEMLESMSQVCSFEFEELIFTGPVWEVLRDKPKNYLSRRSDRIQLIDDPTHPLSPAKVPGNQLELRSQYLMLVDLHETDKALMKDFRLILTRLREKEKKRLSDNRKQLGLRETQRSVVCLLYTSPSPRDRQKSRMPSSA